MDFKTPVSKLTTISPKRRAQLEEGGILTVGQLLLWLPNHYLQAKHLTYPMRNAEGEQVWFKVSINSIPRNQFVVSRNRPFIIKVSCGGISGQLVFFHKLPPFVWHKLDAAEIIIKGRLSFVGAKFSIVQPIIYSLADMEKLGGYDLAYSKVGELKSSDWHQLMSRVIEKLPPSCEYHEQTWLQTKEWPNLLITMSLLHGVSSVEDKACLDKARARLAYDEFLAEQLVLQLARRQQTATRKISAFENHLVERLLEVLPFNLTANQQSICRHLHENFLSGKLSRVLIQGDVGSGKTAIAAYASILAIASKLGSDLKPAQAALMVPTDILASQHFAWLQEICTLLGVKVGLLTGRLTSKVKQEVYSQIASGEIQLVVGTHALIQPDVKFDNLAMVIIDEQHRFGVNQRYQLLDKCGEEGADLILLSATPIPRTLAMTIYGDLEIMVLSEKPAGRKPIKTIAMPIERVQELYDSLARALQREEQVYWVCPLIALDEEDKDKGNKQEDAIAEERYEKLSEIFPGQVVLMHGRLSTDEKQAAMFDFVSGKVKIMVSTTVIEVGVNVPQATVMVIEKAEQFGLAQLHQLRGRVGRNHLDAYCVLLHYHKLSPTAKQRIAIMRASNDGFEIANKDLELRQAGDLVGTKQSGLPQYRVANLDNHLNLLLEARDDAGRLISMYTLSEVIARYRNLLYLFGYDQLVLKG